VPLLLENIAQIKAITFDRILVVDVPEEMQIERTESRDHCGNSMIENIMKNQVSRQIRIAAADDIILNTDNLDSLNTKVDQLHKQYLELAS
jgi:dephospho-CoA kinase